MVGTGPLKQQMWCVLAAFAFYICNFHETTHIAYMPTLRESCGVPFWFATCASIQRFNVLFHIKSSAGTLGWCQVILTLCCTSFLVVWQFACFALLLQAFVLIALACVRITSWRFVQRTFNIYCFSFVLSTLLRFGDLWALRSPLFCLTCAFGLTSTLVGNVRSPLRSILVVICIMPATYILTRAAMQKLAVLQGASLDDDIHISEFMSYRVQLLLNTVIGNWVPLPSPLDYHAALYYGQRSFRSPSPEDLPCSLMLVGSFCTSASVLYETALSFQRHFDTRSRTALFPSCFQFALVCSLLPLFGLMLRYRVLLFPHMSLLAASAFDERLLSGRLWKRLGRWQVPAAVALLSLLIRSSRASLYLPLKCQPSHYSSVTGLKEEAQDFHLLMEWLQENSFAKDIVIAGMGVSARIRLHSGRGTVCHPQYESSQLRERCFWADKVNGHRTIEEYHDIILQHLVSDITSRTVFVAVSIQDCWSVNEYGQVMSHVVELREEHRRSVAKTCHALYSLAGSSKPKGFQMVWLGRWYALLQVLPTAKSIGNVFQMNPSTQCTYARYLYEDGQDRELASGYFRRLGHAYHLDDFDVPCACVVEMFSSLDKSNNVHLRALRLYSNHLANASFGCCSAGRSFLECLVAKGNFLIKHARASLTGERYFRYVASLKPEDPKAHGFLGFARLRCGSYLAALTAFETALRLEGDNLTSTSFCGQALSFAGLGQMVAAQFALEKVKFINKHESCLGMQPRITFLANQMPATPLQLDGGKSTLLYHTLTHLLDIYAAGVAGWRSFLASLDLQAYIHSKDHLTSGRSGLVFLGKPGPEGHIGHILRHLKIIREVHHCKWPAEVWAEAGEAHLITDKELRMLAELGAGFHIVPAVHGSWEIDHPLWRWLTDFPLEFQQHSTSPSRITAYGLKPIVLLLSGCSECLFLDADSILLQSPAQLVQDIQTHGALFWPDIWDAPLHRTIWTTAFPQQTHGIKSQESGQLFVSKTNSKSREALLLATLFANRPDLFLEELYSSNTNKLVCGYGDKDIYHVAFRLVSATYKTVSHVPRIALTTADDGRKSYAGLVQVDTSSKPLILHGNQIKDTLWELILQNRIEECSFKSADDSKNLTCTSAMGAGTSEIPFHSLMCSPLKFPSLKRVRDLLRKEMSS